MTVEKKRELLIKFKFTDELIKEFIKKAVRQIFRCVNDFEIIA